MRERERGRGGHWQNGCIYMYDTIAQKAISNRLLEDVEKDIC